MNVRVVMISDTHGKTVAVPDGDILVHAGDLTMQGKYNEIAQAGEWLRSLPHKYKIVIAGNHDWQFQLDVKNALQALGMGFHYLENSGVEILGLKFWGSPVTPWFYDWAFNAQRGPEIQKYWQKIPAGLDVLITHGPPYGILDQASRRNTKHCGCRDLLTAVNYFAPKVHVFGHIHGGYGKHQMQDTTFYNAAIVDEAYNAIHQPLYADFWRDND